MIGADVIIPVEWLGSIGLAAAGAFAVLWRAYVRARDNHDKTQQTLIRMCVDAINSVRRALESGDDK